MPAVLGLGTRAESVYRALPARPPDGVAALAQYTGHGHAEEQVRDTLGLLSELALVRPSAEQESRLRAGSGPARRTSGGRS
ncbi:hypothetical protein [Streptomyces sp. NPDC054797]